MDKDKTILLSQGARRPSDSALLEGAVPALPASRVMLGMPVSYDGQKYHPSVVLPASTVGEVAIAGTSSSSSVKTGSKVEGLLHRTYKTSKIRKVSEFSKPGPRCFKRKSEARKALKKSDLIRELKEERKNKDMSSDRCSITSGDTETFEYLESDRGSEVSSRITRSLSRRNSIESARENSVESAREKDMDFELESDKDMFPNNHESTDSLQKEKKKKPRTRNKKSSKEIAKDSDEDDSDINIETNQDKRGRPPKSGDYVKRAEKKLHLMRVERDELDFRIEQAAGAEMLKAADILNMRGGKDGTSGVNSADLMASAEHACKSIVEICKISKGLKGTSVAILKGSANTIKTIMHEFNTRTYINKTNKGRSSDLTEVETKLKSAEEQIVILKQEIEQLRQELSKKSNEPKEQRKKKRIMPKQKKKNDWSLDTSDTEVEEVNAPSLNIVNKEEAFTNNLLSKLDSLINSKIDILRKEMNEKYQPKDYLPVNCTYLEDDEHFPALCPTANWNKPEMKKKPIITDIKIIKPPNKSKEYKIGEKGKEKEKDEVPRSTIQDRLHLDSDEELRLDKELKWSKVLGRKGKKLGKAENSVKMPNAESSSRPPRNISKTNTAGKARTRSRSRSRMRRLLTSEAINITCPNGEYEETMRVARSKIKLADIGITNGLRQRVTRTGAISLVITGENREEKVDALHNGLNQIFQDKEKVRIHRPTVQSELIMTGLDQTVEKEDIIAKVVSIGKCSPDSVRVGNFRMGPGRRGTIWIKCPALAANKLINYEGEIVIGWARVGVKLLESRPIQCYKCLEYGHVKAECKGIDRSHLCYKCGTAEHKASECDNEPRCPMCENKKKPFNHRMGSKACLPTRQGMSYMNDVISGPKIDKRITSGTNNDIKETEEYTNKEVNDDECETMDFETTKVARRLTSSESEELPVKKKKKKKIDDKKPRITYTEQEGTATEEAAGSAEL